MKRKMLSFLLSMSFVFSLVAPAYAENLDRNGTESGSHVEQVDDTDLNTSSAQTFAAGNSISTATNISTGTTYSGSITSSNTIDYYKFTIGSSGRITLTATAGMRWIYYCIYDSAGSELWYVNPNWNSTTELISTSETIDLTKGTYYFAAKQDGSYTGNYSFRLNFDTAGESFTEVGSGSNNSMNSASTISVNTNYKGQIAKNDEKDFYKFTLASSGRIAISATAKMQWIYYYVYDSSGNQLWSQNPDWNSTTESISTSEIIDLTKGTYYFVVSRDGSYTGNYSFKLGYTNANESFTETGSGSNNTMASANSITLNTTYRGQLALNDEKDFYRFTLSSSTKVNFTATANVKWIYYRIYDSSGNELWRDNAYWNSVTEKINTSESITLSAGTYYLVFERDGSSTGPYTFKLATHTHSYSNVVTKATTSKNGKIVKRCSCGAVKSTTTIYYPKTITLSSTSYTYDGKVKKPTVTVKGSNGKVISASNYTVSYASGRKNVGKYKVSVKFKGNYSGTVSKTFTITPKATSLTKLTPQSKGFTAAWKKQTVQVTGYQLQYSMSKSFSSKTTKTITKNATASASYKGLKAKKTYYVRIRTYKKVSSTNYYSAWSAVKAVTTKK